MTLPFSIDGARVVIPGVYDVLRVQSSLPAPVAAGRSILILGEAEEGIPGDQLDLRLNFFTDFQSVQSFYKSGPIVDAARQIFSAQPSPVFSGAVQRLYVWKTNATTRASKPISSPANYGTIYAAKYGEDGNMIKSQIKALAEVLPTKTFSFLPSAKARTLKVSVNGAVTTISLSAEATQTDLATALSAIPGLSVSGGTAKTVLSAPATGVVVSVSGDVLTLTKSGAFGTSLVAGDIVVVPTGSGLAGTNDANAGVYTIVSANANSISIRKIKQWQPGDDSAWLPFDSTTPVSLAVGDLSAWGKLTVSVTSSAPVGAGASLEIAQASGGLAVNGMMVEMSAMSELLSADAAAIGSVTVTSSAADSLTLTLTNARWSTVPKAGDVIYIPKASILSGATSRNVGLFVVVSATATSMVIKSAVGVTVDASVGGGPIAGDTQLVLWAPGFASSTVAPKVLKSVSEGKVWIEATNVKTGEAFPTSAIGGTVYVEIGYSDGTASSATLSINSLGVLTITAGSATITARLSKYKTLQNLCDFLNTQTGVVARVADNRFRNLPPSILDQVSNIGILGGFSGASGNGRLKADYWNFEKFMSDNFGLLSFARGSMVLKAGLPAAESSPSFLSGAAVGATSDASIQKGLDEALKIDVRMVVPLFSRDAVDDIADGLTDSASSYLIDSIHAAVKSHVATASSINVKRERFGMLSIHDSFEKSIEKCSGISYERCQMTFMMVRAVDGQGALQWFLPWMGAVVIAAGRAQASLGISMLRKPFTLTAVRHIGKKSIYDDTLIQDFDPENQGQLEQAIEAGLVCFRSVPGFGVRMESPDLSTRSRENDPEGWVWERINILFTLDEVRQTVRTTLENFIGARQSDVSMAVVREAIRKSLEVFVTGGALLNGVVDKVVREGIGYRAQVRVIPAEALEFITVDILAERAPTG